MAYLTTTPRVLRWLQPGGLLWEGPAHTPEPTVYLTFDDGPHPEVTPQVLELLDTYEATATFFCVGENAARYPDLFQTLVHSRHVLGNHTHRHRNGWKTPVTDYTEDVAAAARHIDSRLFRPPYGRITRRQAGLLQADGWKIAMWTVLSGDFDPDRSPEQCYRKVVRHTRPGSILVFHDSTKAAPRLLPVLPRLLDDFKTRGWAFKGLPNTLP